MRVLGRNGFSVAEVLVAVIVLSVGILALAGSAALASRMVGWGRQATRVGLVAAARVEQLRQIAWSTTPPCTAAEWRDGGASGTGVSESWEILDQSGPARRVRVVLRSSHATGLRTDTVLTAVPCGAP